MTVLAAPVLHVQNLKKSFGEVRVLDGVDFDVPRGSIFALLGSNGAGKTTVVRILSTLLRPDSGTAVVDGFDVTTQPADVRESISLTGQFAAVDEVLTGRENLVLMAQPAASQARPRRRGRPAGPLPARRHSRPTRVDVLRRHAPPPRHRHEPRGRPSGDLPGRAHDRARPPLSARGVGKRCSPRSTSTRPEQLADRIAILHEGRIIADGTLAQLKQLIPPATVEYVEKQPTLEDVFLAIVGARQEQR